MLRLPVEHRVTNVRQEEHPTKTPEQPAVSIALLANFNLPMEVTEVVNCVLKVLSVLLVQQLVWIVVPLVHLNPATCARIAQLVHTTVTQVKQSAHLAQLQNTTTKPENWRTPLVKLVLQKIILLQKIKVSVVTQIMI